MKASKSLYWLIARCDTVHESPGASRACKWSLEWGAPGSSSVQALDSDKSMEAVWATWAGSGWISEWPANTNALAVFRAEHGQLYVERIMVRSDPDLWFQHGDWYLPNYQSLQNVIGFPLNSDQFIGVELCLNCKVPLQLV